MMGSRKFFVLSAALALALVGSGTALGQDFCSVTASGTIVRSEGITELGDEVVMSCFAGAVGVASDFEIRVEVSNPNVEVTNRVTENDDDEKIANGIRLRVRDGGAAGTVEALTIAANEVIDATVVEADNEIRGMVTDGGQSVVFRFNRPAVDTRLRVEIEGIRVNASGAAGNNITAVVSATEIPIIGGSQVTLARPRQGLVTSRKVGPVEGTSCAKTIGTGAGALNDNVDPIIAKVEVKEGFATAFKDDSNGQKMRFKLSFSDIPAGVKAWLRPGNTGRTNDLDCSENGSSTLSLYLLTGLDSNGFGQGTAVSISDPESDNYVEVALSNGAGTAFYEVQTSDDTDVESCRIPIAFTWPSGVALGTGSVKASFARLSNRVSADVEDTLLPRFKETGGKFNVITIEDCSTTLLFPFVTNMGGYDTGIAISNTSEDAFGTDAHSGACTIHYHGMMMGGGAAPSQQTSDSIDGGEQLVFLLSSGSGEMPIGGIGGISGAPGFQGYLMARCSFQYGHGLAFMTNGAGGAPTLAQSYLALVVEVRHDDRKLNTNGHEALGQ